MATPRDGEGDLTNTGGGEPQGGHTTGRGAWGAVRNTLRVFFEEKERSRQRRTGQQQQQQQQQQQPQDGDGEADGPPSEGGRGGIRIADGIRSLVSKQKRRFEMDGFNLDLTYITPRIIAMGYPSSDIEGYYRNNYQDVLRFFDTRHGSHYKFYNLCSERSYPASRFHDSVARYPFDDHNPPPLRMFLPFCRDVEEYLNAHEDNVAAIHCKAGKGRTGVMICAFLLYTGEWRDADDAMSFYGFARTNNQKGVTIPSQRRFIRYFAQLVGAASDESLSDAAVRQRLTGGMGDVDHIRTAMREAHASLPSGEEHDTDSENEGDAGAQSPTPSARSSNRRSPVPADTKEEEEMDGCAGGGAGGPEQPNVMAVVDDETQRKLDGMTTLVRRKSMSGRKGGYTMESRLMSQAVMQLEDMTDTAELSHSTSDSGVDAEREEARLHEVESAVIRGSAPAPLPIILTELQLSSVPKQSNTFSPVFMIRSCGIDYWSTTWLHDSPTFRKSAGTVSLPIPHIPVVDEVLIVVCNQKRMKRAKLFGFWFHTAFVSDGILTIPKAELDKAVRDKKHKSYTADFAASVLFEPMVEGGSELVTPTPANVAAATAAAAAGGEATPTTT